MALFVSSLKFKPNHFTNCLSSKAKPQFTTLCSKSKIPISKNCKFINSINTHDAKSSTKRAKSSGIPIPESESYPHRIWWSKVEVKMPRNVFQERKWSSIDVVNLCLLVTLHLLALFGPFTFNWGAFWVFVVLKFVTGMLGITLSYHRNLTHRSFNLPKWLEYTFAYCGVLALQRDPIFWVSTHRFHHQYTDSEQDPHSPLEGFWFSHINWLLDARAITQKCGEPSNVRDLEQQPFYRFIRSTYWLHPLLLGVLLYALGGFPYLVWGMGVRTIVMYHMTFAVNSACHIWGKQGWNTDDLSRNNWWVALLTFGEGWHNNHHAFEYSARHGLEWWQIDMTWYTIKLLQLVGLATHVKLPTKDHKQRLKLNNE